MFRNVTKEELRVPGKVEYLGDLRDFVTRVGKKFGFSERVVNAFKLSIDEAATNIIKHAYRDWSGDITIRAVAKKNSLTIVLIDQGKYFDPRQVSSPDLQRYVEIGKRGGLGIFIMRRLLDNIEYRKTEEGNELWMVKNRDEAKQRKIALSTIPLSLKMRYWLYSIAIFTTVLVFVTLYNFFNSRTTITNDYIENGRTACSFLDGEVSNNWNEIDADVIDTLITKGSIDVEVVLGAEEGIRTLVNSEHSDILNEVIITDKRNVILANSDTTRRSLLEEFQMPESAKLVREYPNDSKVYLFTKPSGQEVLNIVWPIKNSGGESLADLHFQIDNALVEKDKARYSTSLFTEVAFVWVIVSAGLFLLIYVVMNPFKRLQDWVKQLSEPGVVEQMDIDSSTEIGAIAQAFSDMTIQLRRSQQDLAEQERLQQEMHIAKQIQQTLLPTDFPQLEGYDINSFYAAAKEVGGDFFDFVEVDNDTLGVAVADVSGKGVPGAFVMTMIRTALRSEARGVKDAAEVLAKVNDFVVNDMKKGMFVTLFYVIIDSKRRRLNFASAGHNPMILHRPSRNRTYYLNPRGFPIGISLPDKDLFRTSIESDTIALAEDDILLVYTDGVTEAMNPKRRLFGEERFLKLIRECGKQSAEEFVDSLKKDMNTFTEGSEQNDDITLVAIKENTSAEQVEYDRAVRAYQLVQEGVSIKDACKKAGISIYSYYQKYKDIFDKEGVDSFTVKTDVDQIEAKHLSIEEKNKIYDIIRRHPEYGAKRIHEELNTERYEFEEIPVSKIYEELVRMRLNTKELRETFVQRGGRKKRIKPPGTPMMTVDGKIIMNRTQYEEPEEEEDIELNVTEPSAEPEESVEKAEDQAVESVEEPTDEPQAEKESANIFNIDKTKLLTTPIEDLLDKRSIEKEPPETADLDSDTQETEPGEDHGEIPEAQAPEPEAVDEESDTFSEERIPDEPVSEEIKAAEEDWEFDSQEHGFAEEEEFQSVESAPDEDEDVDSEKENANSPKWTIVSDEQLERLSQQDDDERSRIEDLEQSFFDTDSDLELLSNYSEEDEDDEFSFHVPVDQEFQPVPPKDESSEEDEEADHEPAEDSEEWFKNFDFVDSEAPANDEAVEATDDEDDTDRVVFKDLLPNEESLSWQWSEHKHDNDEPKNSESENDHDPTLFEDDSNLTDPFEEFLEIEDEHGLVTPEGEFDYELAETLFNTHDEFVDNDEQTRDDSLQVDDLPKSSEQVEKREIEEEEISLDELISISDDEEPLLAQEDEEFDSLLLDAVSKDDKKLELFKGTFQHGDDDMGNESQNRLDRELREAIRMYNAAHYDDAIDKLRHIAFKYPKDYRTHSLLGNAYFRERKYREAAVEYERVIDLDPLNENACENLAIAYANQGDLHKAIRQWERLLRITPNRRDVQRRIDKAKAFLNKI